MSHRIEYFQILVIVLFFVIGCSNETAVENPTASSVRNPTVDIAKAGNVAIDTDIDCNNGLQNNHVGPGANISVWVSSNPGGGSYCFRLFDNNSQVGCGDTFQFDDDCFKSGNPPNSGTFWQERGDQIDNAPGASGTYRAKVNVGACSGCSGVTGPNIGGDGFSVD